MVVRGAGPPRILTTRLWSQVGLFIVGFLAFAVPALASIWWRGGSRRRCPSGASASSRCRTRRARSPWARWRGDPAVPGVAGAWSGNWETILLFTNGGDWGSTDPNLGRDIGFYVFDLPFWRFLLGWASTA